MSKMKIAFFTVRPSFSSHCSVWSLMHLLANDIERIDVFSQNDVLSGLTLPENVGCIYVHGSSRSSIDSEYVGAKFLSLIRKFKDYLKCYKFTAMVHDAIRDTIKNKIRDRKMIWGSFGDLRRVLASTELLEIIDGKCRNVLYDFAIGLGHQGLILAHMSLPGIPLVYFSDEIFYNGHPEFHGPKFSLEKNLEKQAFNDVALVLIQDEDRAGLLFRDNGVPYQPEKVIHFPVSWPGKARIWRSDFFIQRFPELQRKKLLLQHGSLVPQRHTGELLQVSTKCPETYSMVFHGKLSPYLKRNYNQAKCWFSEPNAPIEKLEEVAAGAHIGLVFYTASNENDRLIAHASGQLALYLKCGVPVIVNNKGTLAPLVRSWNCGLVVENERDIFDAADLISQDYKFYCQKAVECFNEEYNLQKFYPPLLKKLKN